MTPSEYMNVDPSVHTWADLVDAITVDLVLFGGHSQHPQKVAQWLLHCRGGDEHSAYELAREIVKHLRGDQQEVVAMKIELALDGNQAPLLP